MNCPACFFLPFVQANTPLIPTPTTPQTLQASTLIPLLSLRLPDLQQGATSLLSTSPLPPSSVIINTSSYTPMDTIMQRRLHKDAPALSLLRKHFQTYLEHHPQQQEDAAAAAPPPPAQRRGRGGRKKTDGALRAQAYQALAANSALRAELVGTATTTSTRSWSDLLAFFPPLPVLLPSALRRRKYGQ